MIVTVKAIIPNHPLIDMAKMEAAINKALDKTADEAKESFEKTTATWNNKPPFVIEKGMFERKVFTSNDIYFYVSGGTKPHVIVPKQAKSLHFFATGFSPKSRFRYIGSNKGAAANSDETFTQLVHHPGTRAREFEVAISILYERFFPEYMQEAIDEAVK